MASTVDAHPLSLDTEMDVNCSLNNDSLLSGSLNAKMSRCIGYRIIYTKQGNFSRINLSKLTQQPHDYSNLFNSRKPTVSSLLQIKQQGETKPGFPNPSCSKMRQIMADILCKTEYFGLENMIDHIVGKESNLRPPNQEDQADEALYRQIGAASRSQALVLIGNFNHPDISWRDNTAGHKQPRRFLEQVDDNFLLQVIEEPKRRGAMVDPVLTNKEGLVGNVKLKASLGCSGHKMVEFKTLRAARRAHSKLTALDFRRADFGLFRDLLGRVPWDEGLEGRGAQENWLVFKDHLLHAQE
ncbi:hypothetical protein GRJ2_001259400 [Grus japonensis]|uniref:Glycerol kinase n=1 Tax=Grus japonensis TaxID=30415 RepID=A0ABC9WRY7_GRUJA